MRIMENLKLKNRDSIVLRYGDLTPPEYHPMATCECGCSIAPADILPEEPKIKKVIFNPPATIILWDDGKRTVVKTMQGETYDPYAGFCIAYTKRIFGNNSRIKHFLHKNSNYDAFMKTSQMGFWEKVFMHGFSAIRPEDLEDDGK